MLKAAIRVEKNQFQNYHTLSPSPKFQTSISTLHFLLENLSLAHTLVGPLKVISKILHMALLS